MKYEKALENIKTLLNTKLYVMGRASDLIWIMFTNGKEEYSIHIQCPLRVIKNNTILFTGCDMYYPAMDNKDDDEFDWDIQGNNVYDIDLSTLFWTVNSFSHRAFQIIKISL